MDEAKIPSNLETRVRYCFNCGEKGHSKADCQNESTPAGQDVLLAFANWKGKPRKPRAHLDIVKRIMSSDKFLDIVIDPVIHVATTRRSARSMQDLNASSFEFFNKVTEALVKQVLKVLNRSK